jgi:DNA replication protein DnaC
MADIPLQPRLGALGLHGMAEAIDTQRANSIYGEMTFEDRVSHMVLAEEEARGNRMREGRRLQRSLVTELCTGNWIDSGHNLIVAGPTGTGQTHVCCALGLAAARLGRSVRYFRINLLLEQIGFAREDGTVCRMRAQIAKADLVILDDLAIAPLDEQTKEDLLELPDARVGEKSTIVAGQRTFSEWHEFLDNPILADAILDRMSQQAYKIQLKGDSRRRPL